MSYRSILRAESGVTMGLWRPQEWADGPVALLLGRDADQWFGTDESGQPRNLVAENYWAVTVDTGWGNQTDLDAIDDALAWAESVWQRDIGRVIIIAHGRGAVAAMNWSRLNAERVASLQMMAPVVDLETHYVRNPSDQASMLAAYGGTFSTFLAAMPTWNPSRHQRRYNLRDFMRNRMHIWAAPNEAVDEAYVRLPGGASNHIFVSDLDTLDITGDISVRWYGAADNWASGSEQTLIGKWHTTGNQRTWKLLVSSTGQLQAQLSTDGSTTNTYTASVNPTVTNGQYKGLGFSWVQATGLLTFYQSDDGETWTQLGSTQNVLAGQSLFVSTARLEIGSNTHGSATGAFVGAVKKAQLDGVTDDGPVSYSTDFTTQTAGSRYVADDVGDIVWQFRGSSQLLGGPLTERFAEAIAAERDVLDDDEPTSVDPAPLIESAVSTDTAWNQQPAVKQTMKWINQGLDATLTTDWAGADGFHAIPLPDGRVLWTFSDTFTGTVNSDGSRSGAVMINNSLVIEEADGTLSETIHASGSSGPGIVPPDADHYYWLNDGVVEQENGQDVIRIFAYDSEHVPGGWTINEIHLVTLDATTFDNLGYQVRSTSNATWNDFLERPDYTYVSGYLRDWIFNRPTMARAPVGNITGTWEYWNGTGWTTDESQVAAMQDIDGNPMEGSGSMYYHNGKYIHALKDSALWGNNIEIWTSDNPQGPWTLHAEYPIYEQSSERFGMITTCYGANFIPHLPADPGHILVLYCTNGWNDGPGVGQGYSLNSIDASIYSARFIQVPLPE